MALGDLAALLRCPRCLRGDLSLQRAGWICGDCSAGFPVLGELPWLFAEPQSMLAQWRARLQFLMLSLEREARTLRAEMAADNLSDLTKQRLEMLAGAHTDHVRRLAQLLTPLGVAAAATGYETHLALRTRLPSDQGLTNYYVNLHRDWVWGAAENEASLALVRSIASGYVQWGRTLVLGAGSGRLAYDIHMQCAPELTIAADFNPLLLFVARNLTRGEKLELYEFPIAPRRLADHAVLRILAAPEPVRAGFHIVAADALRAPFAPGSFDIVLTPWLVDILTEDFVRFAAQVNSLLRSGGCWVNFGSLAFAQGTRTQRLSFEETLEAVRQAGFCEPATEEGVFRTCARRPADMRAWRRLSLGAHARNARCRCQRGGRYLNGWCAVIARCRNWSSSKCRRLQLAFTPISWRSSTAGAVCRTWRAFSANSASWLNRTPSRRCAAFLRGCTRTAAEADRERA